MKNAPQGMGEAVPAYTTVLLHYDPCVYLTARLNTGLMIVIYA